MRLVARLSRKRRGSASSLTFFEPAVREFGAHLYRFLSLNEPLVPTARIDGFVASFPEPEHGPLNAALQGFLHPTDSATRAFVLRSLNAYFFLEATNLSGDVIAALARASRANPTFELFVDTNFLLYLVGLRDDAYNAVPPLLDLIRRLERFVRVRLNVLPTTIDEAKRVISATQASLSGVRATKTLVDAAKRAGLDSIAEKFLNEAKDTRATAQTYFGPYLRDLIEIIRARGAEFFNTRMEQFKTDQRVIDDLLAQQSYEQQHYGEKAKGYEQLEHDVTLWHFVQRRRPARIESPLEAGAWVLTLDYRFINFDADKSKRSNSHIPVCIHPATLIQLLQFWSPRTKEFEDAVFGSMGVPFFQNFGVESERITIRILDILGRFEHVDQLPADAATRILMNDALRQRLTPDLPEEEQTTLVKTALCKELQDAARHCATLDAQRSALKAAAADRETVLTTKEDELDELRRQLGQRNQNIDTLTRQLREERQQNALQQWHREAVEQRVEAMERAQTRRAQLAQFRNWFIVPALVLTISTPVAIRSAHPRMQYLPDNHLAVAAFLAATVISLVMLQQAGLRNESVSASPGFQRFNRFKKSIFAILGTLLLAVIGNALTELLKGDFAR
jgi:hypothetical protein